MPDQQKTNRETARDAFLRNQRSTSRQTLRGSAYDRKATLDQFQQQVPTDVYRQLEEIYKYEGIYEQLESDLEKLSAEPHPPQKPSFPIVIFIAAIIKDLADAATGGIVSVILSLLLGFILWLWWFNKSSFIKKKIKKWFVKRVILFLAGDSIPVVSIFVPSSLFIILWYYREKKIVQIIQKVLFVYGQAAKIHAQQIKVQQKQTARNVERQVAA